MTGTPTAGTKRKRHRAPDARAIFEIEWYSAKAEVAAPRRGVVECPEAAHLLYKIIAARNQKRSTAVVANVDFEKWGDYLPDRPLAMAFLNRLLERAIILKVTGKSPIAPGWLNKPQRPKPQRKCRRKRLRPSWPIFQPAEGRSMTHMPAPFHPPKWPCFSPPSTPKKTLTGGWNAT